MTLSPEQAAAVDEFGEITQKIEAFSKTPAAQKLQKQVARHEELKKLIASWYDKEPANQAFVADGKLWGVSVSERADKREIIDMPAVFKAIGEPKFLMLCSFRLEDADRFLSEEIHKQAVKKEQIGKRKLGQPVAKFPERKPVKKAVKLAA